MHGLHFTLISIVFWGLTGIFVKLLTRTVHPLTAGYLVVSRVDRGACRGAH